MSPSGRRPPSDRWAWLLVAGLLLGVLWNNVLRPTSSSRPAPPLPPAREKAEVRKEQAPSPAPREAPRAPRRPAVKREETPHPLPSPETARREQVSSLWLPPPLRRAYEEGQPFASLAQSEIERGNPTRPWVALTFDAHFEAQPLPDLLRLLEEYQVKATFFLTGHWVEKNPSWVRRLAQEGHELGNHTYSHQPLTQLSEGEILSECERTEDLLRRYSGRTFPPYVRPPYGERDLRVVRVLLEHGFLPVYWTVDSLDWKEETTPGDIVGRILERGAEKGAILLLHAGSAKTVQALPDILEGLGERGLRAGRLCDVLAE